MRRRLWQLLGVGSIATLAAACGADEQRSYESELNAVVADAQVRGPFPGIAAVEEGRRSECYNPAFDREPPAVWFTYSVDGERGRELRSQLVDRFMTLGWETKEDNARVVFSGDSEFGPIYGQVTAASSTVRVILYLHEDWTCG